jgi:hypothetical protein
MSVRMVPLWLAWPLVCLGAWYVFAFPLGFGWLGYGLSVALAVAVAVWAVRDTKSLCLNGQTEASSTGFAGSRRAKKKFRRNRPHPF